MRKAEAPARTALLDSIRHIVGDRGMLTGPDVEARSCDPFRHLPPGSPAIVRPASTAELAAVLSLCHGAGQKIVTHGGRTGVVGGALAGADELVISLERMSKVLEIDPIGMTATAEAGATIEAVQNAAAEHGLFYPIDLGAKGSATVGGTIATNAGGNRVLRWGMTRQNVLGIEAVLADGAVLSVMNRFLKNNTGYDLKQLFVGSEGTVGIVTRAILRLVPAPSTQKVAFLSVGTYGAVLDLLTRARQMQQLSAFEVMWRDYYAMVAGRDPSRRPVDCDQPFYVLVEAMGYDQEADEAAFQAFLEQALRMGLLADAVCAHSIRQANDLWRVREASEILVREMGPFVSFDVSVDIRKGEQFVLATREELDRAFGNYKAVTFGHLGDSNLHLGVHVGPDTHERELEIEEIVYAVVRRFGGALTAEHGIGSQKRKFLPQHISAEALETMRRLRGLLDRRGVLNQSVLF